MYKFLSVISILAICFGRIEAQKTLTKKQEEVVNTSTQKADYFLKTLQIHYGNGDYQLHKDYSDSLYNIASKHQLTKMQVLALVNQAVFYKNRSERQKAIQLYHEAQEQCKRIPNDYKTNIIVLVNLGNIYDDIGLPKKAIESMQKVLVLTDTINNTEVIRAAAYIGLSNNYAKINDSNRALENAFQAKELGEKIKNESITAVALGNISDSYYHQKKYKSALEIGQKALALKYLKKSTKRRASILLNVGLAHFKLNHFEEAIKFLSEAKQIALEKKLLEIEMHTHEHLAALYEQKGDLKAANEAQKLYTKTRKIHFEETTKAGQLELNKDIDLKDKEIIDTKTVISNMEDKTRNLVTAGVLICLLLSAVLFFYIRRKKILEQEKLVLRQKYQNLKSTIATIKANPIKQTHQKTTSYRNSSLTSADYDNYKQVILSYMKEERPYLKAELKQIDLAKKLNLTSHHFSEILNTCFNQNFYSFINSYRVLNAQNLMKNKKHAEAKIIAIAFDSGFKSKTSFNRVFKKYTGFTPTEYKNNL